MAAGLRLELRQGQQLVMTPQLQQAIRLLQMSNLELGAFVAQELERNPLLTLDTGEPDAGPEPVRAPEAPVPETDRRVTAEGDMGLAAETFDTGTENLYDTARADGPDGTGPLPGESGAFAGLRGAGGLPEDAEGAEERGTRGPTLREHLLEQIGQMRAPLADRALAALIVEELDEAGYLRGGLGPLAGRLGVGEAEAAPALALVQRCDPTGVGARDLAECLALQLAERDRLDPAMAALLANLELLGRGELARLRRLCGVDAEDFTGMVAELRALDPRPGARFDAVPVEVVVPDVFVRRNRWGGWLVELNAETLPRVLIDRRYAAELARGGEQTRAFLSECRESAGWLVKSLDQRARTILKVTTEILRQQEAFFEQGTAGLRPLSLKMVADAIGMHESTVSRVTSGKYMATERGIFELKFFFSNAVGGEGEDAASAESVRHRLRALIEAEKPDAVLSDDQLVEMLRAEGLDIARRTVAKYRKSLGIPSSVDRRRQAALRGAL